MERALACSVGPPGFDSRNIQVFFSSRISDGKREMEPVIIKLHDLDYPSEKI